MKTEVDSSSIQHKLSVQHELSMAIGNDLKLQEMLKIFMLAAIERLGLNSAHLFLFCDGDDQPIHVEPADTSPRIFHYLSIPLQHLGESWEYDHSLQLAVEQHVRKDNFVSVITLAGKVFQFFSVPTQGVMIFETTSELDDAVKQSLQPIFKKLALSCYACIAHETLVREMTARRSAEDTIAHQAAHDELTQLFNRRKLTENLEASLKFCREHNKFGALIFIDLNQFKSINDVMGHDVGDKILQEVAARLKAITRGKDTVARFGGDEFIILLPELGGAEDVAEAIVTRTAARIHDAVEIPFTISGAGYNISCSIGFEIFPSSEESPNDVIKHADLAMYEAKTLRQRVALRYNVSMSEKLNTRLAYIAELKNALKNNELMLYYQPQYNIKNQIIGAEALLRWNNPKRFGESPAGYISIAEDSDLILTIGDWVFNEACRHLKILQEQGVPDTFKKLAINVSARQLSKDNFFADICHAIQRSGVNACQLSVEITENILITRIHDAMTLIGDLKTIGIDCAIDDFGTGYSSLTYLRRLSARLIKIDRSFVKDIHKDAENRSIAKMIIALGNNLDMAILAEGVETEEELQCLMELGCNQYQGYYFAHPLPFEKFLSLMTSAQIEAYQLHI